MKSVSQLRWAAVAFALGLISLFDFGAKQTAKLWPRKPTGSSPISPDTPVPSHRTFHPNYHHGFVPGASGAEDFGPFRTQYFINSLGMRDAFPRRVPAAKPVGGRILLLGDSYVDGVGVAFSQTSSGQLAEALGPRGLEVLNGGVASYCPSLIEARFRSWVERDGLTLDLVVVFLDISDMDNELRYQKNHVGLYSQKDSASFAHEIQKVEKRNFWFRQRILGWVEENFVLWGALARNSRILYERAGSPGGFTPYLFSDWPAYRGPLEPWIQESLRRQEAAMDRLLALCRSRKVGLVVLVYPWLEQIQRGHAEDRHTRFWQAWCKDRQVPFLSLYPDFIALRKQIDHYTLDERDGHWNETGHAVVAARLQNFLESNKLLPSHGKR